MSMQRVDGAAIAKLNFRESVIKFNEHPTFGIVIRWRARNTEIMICIYDGEAVL